MIPRSTAIAWQPEPLQLLTGIDGPRKLRTCAPPFEARLHRLIEDNPDLFSHDWMWIGAQIRSQSAKIIDLLALDRRGRTFAVNAHRQLDAPSALCEGLASLSWLQSCTYPDLNDICQGYRRERLEDAFYRRFGEALDRDRLNNAAGLVLVVADSARARGAVQTLARHGMNIWMMEFSCFGDDAAATYAFIATN